MKNEIRGLPIGQYPDLEPGTKVVYKTPTDFIFRGSNTLITLARGVNPDQFIIAFCTWCKDCRFKRAVKGTWYCKQISLNTRQLHALQRMDLGGLG